MRIANVENNTLNWVLVSSAAALDMTHCDFSVRSARDEMRHIVGINEPDVIIGFDKDQNRGCKKKDKYLMEFRTVRSASCARSLLRARADVRSELENEVRGEDDGHAGDENSSRGSVHVRVGWVR